MMREVVRTRNGRLAEDDRIGRSHGTAKSSVQRGNNDQIMILPEHMFKDYIMISL